MTKYSGRIVKVEIGLEPSRGGGPANTANKFLLPKVTYSVKDRREKFKINASQGHIGENHGELPGDKWVEGDLEGDVRDRSFGIILAAFLGIPTQTTPDATQHTYTLTNDNAGQTCYLKVIDPNQTVLHRNVRITSLSINSKLGDKVMWKATFIGKASIPSSSSVAVISENLFSKNHFKVFLGADTDALDAASRLSIKEFNMTMERNGENDSSLGTAEPEDFLTKSMRITGDYLLNYEDQTFKNYYLANTERAMRVQMLNNDVTIGSSDNPEFLVDFVSVFHDDWDPDRSNDEIVKQKQNFECHLDEVNGRFWDDMYLVNTQSDYDLT
jgi:hypothetical protein